MSYNVGDTAYYRAPFGVRLVKILKKKVDKRLCNSYGDFECTVKYLVQFKTGRRKIISERKLF